MELEEEEQLVAPVRPQRITRNMRSGDMLKLQRETSKAVLSHLIYDMEEKESEATVRYEGDSSTYRLWERAVISATEGIDFNYLEMLVKHDEIDEFSDADWDLWYTAKDRRFLYRILMDTLSPEAKDIVERQDKNGVLVFRFFLKRWGTPTISNSITALQELTTIKLPMCRKRYTSFFCEECKASRKEAGARSPGMSAARSLTWQAIQLFCAYFVLVRLLVCLLCARVLTVCSCAY